MSEKLAVRCRNKEEARKVFDIGDRRLDWTTVDYVSGEQCISLPDDRGYECFHPVSFYKGQGYRIIEAQEYLGGESVKQEFKVGEVRRYTGSGVPHGYSFEIINANNSFGNPSGIVRSENGEVLMKNHPCDREFIEKLINTSNTKTKEEVTMGFNKIASEVYDKTADAELVDKWAVTMGIRHDEFGNVLFVKQNKAEFLKEAKRLQAEQDSRS